MLILTVGKKGKRVYVSDDAGSPICEIRSDEVMDNSLKMGFLPAPNCAVYGDQDLSSVRPFMSGNVASYVLTPKAAGVVIEQDGFPVCRVTLTKTEHDGFYPKARIAFEADPDIVILRCDVLRRNNPKLYNAYTQLFKDLEKEA